MLNKAYNSEGLAAALGNVDRAYRVFAAHRRLSWWAVIPRLNDCLSQQQPGGIVRGIFRVISWCMGFDGSITTYSGVRFWPLLPNPDDIRIEDIAHSLANQCRFAGHSRVFYSVAEHSVRVSQLCKAVDALWGLLHDASVDHVKEAGVTSAIDWSTCSLDAISCDSPENQYARENIWITSIHVVEVLKLHTFTVDLRDVADNRQVRLPAQSSRKSGLTCEGDGSPD